MNIPNNMTIKTGDFGGDIEDSLLLHVMLYYGVH